MEIKTEQDISSAAARHLREGSGETQKAFWQHVGVTQSGGSRYEQNAPIPKSVRVLLYLLYVANLRIDASTEAGARDLDRLAKLQRSEWAAEKVAVGARLDTAMKHVKAARSVLNEIV